MSTLLRTIAPSLLGVGVALASASCGGGATTGNETTVTAGRTTSHAATPTDPEREAPPASADAREVAFPTVERTNLDNGLAIDSAKWERLPIVYVNLVVKRGSATDPSRLPGLSQLVASMMKEGTRKRPSAKLAEEVEFLGADLSIYSDEESLHVDIRALAEHFSQAMDIVADVVTAPAFDAGELNKLKQRERDRLAQQLREPGFLAARTFYRTIYGDHPYSHIDATEESIRAVKRQDLVEWHRTNVVPNESFLVVVGDIEPAAVRAEAERVFSRWTRRDAPPVEYSAPPTRSSRDVIVVDRPDSVQSQIIIGNLGVQRSAPDFIPLLVANQVLGGSAASRLFMDLRERRSLTYGAYSGLTEASDVGVFRATGSVRTEVTEEAVDAFFEHLDAIVVTAAPPAELVDAKRYLSDSFPLRIDTPGKIAQMIGDLRLYGLPANYWDSYRAAIGRVTPEEALAAAHEHIHPDRSVVVVVGNATSVAPALRSYGEVRIVDANGEPVAVDPATATPATAPADPHRGANAATDDASRGGRNTSQR